MLRLLPGSAVTIFYLVCVASILILASIFPISIFRFNTFDFRQPQVPISIFDFSFSVFPILGLDIWFSIIWLWREAQVTKLEKLFTALQFIHRFNLYKKGRLRLSLHNTIQNIVTLKS